MKIAHWYHKDSTRLAAARRHFDRSGTVQIVHDHGRYEGCRKSCVVIGDDNLKLVPS